MADTDQPEAPRFRSAVAWSYAMDGGRQSVTFLLALVLAALLGPEIFGTFALANLAVLFAQLVLNNGMSAAIIQRADLDERGLATAFWIMLVSSFGLAGALVLLAPAWSAVNGDPADLTAVNRALAMLIPLQGLNVVQGAVRRRDLDFRTVTRATLSGVVVGAVVALALAFGGAGVWALVWQQLVSLSVSTILLWVVTDWRPSFVFDFGAARGLLGFTGGALLSSIGQFVRNRADSIVIGIVLGPIALGLYRFADRFSDLVITVSVRALQGASLPGLSRLQDDPTRLRVRILETYRLAAVLASVPLALIFVGTDVAISLVGIDDWGPAATGMRVLTLAALTRAIAMMTAPVLQARGRPYIVAAIMWSHAAVATGLFLGASLISDGESDARQVAAMSIARGVSITVAMVVDLSIVARLTPVGFGELVDAVYRPIVAAAVSSALAWVVAAGLGLHVFVESVLQGGVVVAVFAVLWVVDPSIRRLVGDAASMARGRKAAQGS